MCELVTLSCEWNSFTWGLLRNHLLPHLPQYDIVRYRCVAQTGRGVVVGFWAFSMVMDKGMRAG